MASDILGRVLGVVTAGNATLVAYDDEPILATDPWFGGEGAYFGSWHLSHEFPPDVRDDVRRCRFIWLSHGHPDHLNGESLDELRSAVVLVPDHVGGRIARDLRRGGYEVRVMPDRSWVPLSEHIRVMCITDYFQDALLLVEVNGRLFVDMNDASDRGWGTFVRGIVSGYERSYLLKLAGYGDADMINIFDERGERVPPFGGRRPKVGRQLAAYAQLYGTTDVIPFSSFHRYQRTDSAWANEHATPLEAYEEGFEGRARLHPAFARVDCRADEVTPVGPRPSGLVLRTPEEFGDVWSDALEADERVALESYVSERQLLRRRFEFVRFVVGGEEHTVKLRGPRDRGISFEVPRHSLMLAVNHEIFDDLLIGNFMRTTLHGGATLSPHFTPVVAKLADNGGVKTRGDHRSYMLEYRRRMGAGTYVRHRIGTRLRAGLHARLNSPSGVGTALRSLYHRERKTS